MKTYRPVWCEEFTCMNCDLISCNKRALDVLLPYRDEETPMEKRGAPEVTSIAVFFEFCPRLGEIFMQFPSLAPIGVVYSNFTITNNGKPSSQAIQRILLDILASRDPQDVTDGIFLFRGKFSALASGNTKFGLDKGTHSQKYTITKSEIESLRNKLSEFLAKLYSSSLQFPKIAIDTRCTICPFHGQC